jgi:spoIIIJ-associated protein
VLISSDDAGRIIGRKGQTLESLQLLVNRMLFKSDENAPLVTLDIDGYADGDRDRRGKSRDKDANGENGDYPRRPRRNGNNSRSNVAQLELQAQDAAKEVKRWGEPIRLPEMNAHDRRIIHITLKDDPEVVTESIGEGAMKKVMISLKKSE